MAEGVTAVRASSRTSVFRPSHLVWVVAGVGTFALAVALVLDSFGGDWQETASWVPFCVSFVGVGVVIVHRSSSKIMGWLFLAVGCTVAASQLFSGYANFAMTRDLPGASWSGMAFILTIWLSLLAFLVIQLFPDGQALSHRWRWLAAGTIVVGLLGMGASGLSQQDDFASNFPTLEHPLRLVPEPMAGWIFGAAQLATLAIIGLSAVCLATRYRRSQGQTRQQLKWLVAASGLVATGFILCGLWPEVFGEPVVAFLLLMPLVPLACGIAILRYRLYDMDRIIGRTTSYLLVSGVLLVVYGVVVTSVGRLLPEQSDSLAVAAATLAAAALFRPVLRWARGVVDRWFNRDQYDAGLVVERFAVRLRTEVESGEIRDDLLDVLNRTMQPTSSGLWLADREVQ